MTDKEIIIDGADVSKCGFFHPKYDTDCHIALAFSDQYEGCMKCECNPNCYFKQLARAKEENEKLKEQLNNNQQEDDRGYCETYDRKYYNNLEECQKQNCWYKYYSKEHTKNVQLKKELQAKEQEIEKLNVIIDRFLVASGKSKDLTEPEDFERVFEDIEQTYSEHEDLKAENDEYRHAICEIGRLLSDALDTEKTNTDESFANFYKCLEIIKKTKEVE